MSSFDRIVVGGGLAGLLAAKRALDRGERVVVFDSGEFGGLVSSTNLGAHRIDSAAESFSTAGDAVTQLLAELGLSDKICLPTTAAASIIAHGTRYPIPAGYMGIPEDLEDPELHSIFSADEIALAQSLDRQPFRDYDTVADLISGRLGPAFLTRLVNPVFAGVHASSADRLSAKKLLSPFIARARELNSLTHAVQELTASRVRPGSSVAGLSGGLSVLIDTLVAHLSERGAQLRSHDRVTAVTRATADWVVASEAVELEAKAITLASGLEFLRTLSGPLSGLAHAADKANTVSVTLAILLVQSAQLNRFPLGPGALITDDAGFVAKATTHANSKWQWLNELLAENQHVIRLSFGRNGEQPGSDLLEVAARELALIYGVDDAVVLDQKLITWRNALLQPNDAAMGELSAEVQRLAEIGLEVCGGQVTGNGLLAIATDHEMKRAA
jgi:protoporphyrinogen/coproporphyrinogen III oxidase